MSDRSRSRSPEPAAAPAPAADASNGDAPAVQTASSETTGEEVKLYLGNLSYDTDEARIQEKFREAGLISWDGRPSDATNRRINAILQRVKILESEGACFEEGEGSVKLMLLHSTAGYCPPFRVLEYSVSVSDIDLDSATRVMKNDSVKTETCRATIKLQQVDMEKFRREGVVDEVESLEVSEGVGPVDALKSCLEKALSKGWWRERRQEIVVTDYAVVILDGAEGTEVKTRVSIEFTNVGTKEKWKTTSVDRNIISASLNALVDGYEYALIEHETLCFLCTDEDEDEDENE